MNFVGDKVLSTFAFLQALATRSFIIYSLHAESPKHLCTRIEKELTAFGIEDVASLEAALLAI